MTWNTWTNTQLEHVRADNRWREALAIDPSSIVSFASNDYLALSTHPKVCAAAIDAIQRFGAGATASRLVAGTRSIHDELELAIAVWQGTQRALAFSTGYQANLAAMTVFGASDVTIFSDELNHASIIDGCRLANARVVVYRHCDVEHLRSLMQAHDGRQLVVTDAVFSMDGDVAPLAALADLCTQRDALLVLDEAHAVMQLPTALPCETLRVGTLSKSLGAHGGWIAGSRAMIELLVNRARSFIFTTALAPADTAAALAALRIYTSEEGAALRAHLSALIDMLKPAHPSPIIPFVLGNEHAALAMAARLHEQGIHIPAIRPPSVPIGTSRLRIALSAQHSVPQVATLKRLLSSLSA